MALTLYSAEICPYALRTRLVLAEKNIPHDVVEIDLDDKPSWFLELTPAQKVPVIDHDGFLLWESATVNEYLDAVFDGPSLSPRDERKLAIMRNEIRSFDSTFLTVLYRLLFEQDPNAQAALRVDCENAMRALDRRLGEIQDDGPYWLGRELSLADCATWPFFERLCVFRYYRDIDLPADCARLAAWIEAMAARPAAQAEARDEAWYVPRYTAYATNTAQGLSAQAFRSGQIN